MYAIMCKMCRCSQNIEDYKSGQEKSQEHEFV